ncbi:hypothetical protein CAPTEDRAFT_187003 [Capitella teleta]|uniref:Uncharacterized protein n=1 Tax=Capitella teleta TaxID=283909 RepID=R7V343_CAPTE|nr:hypothetical protein CAPTEDRAFT_187003 [Capitella teleta]|eukprot:ELU10741.1 hypothetical protein CAPTEDRAFT_187003 [Capitella teleta]
MATHAATFTNLEVPAIDWSAPDVSHQYTEFQNLCELYFAGPLADTAADRHVKYLLLWAGREGRQITDSWTLTEDEKKKLKPYWDRFKKHVQPKSNFRLARHELSSTRQLKEEPVDVFVRRLQAIGRDCEYDELDEQLIDALIFELNSATVQKKLLQKDKYLTFEQAITTARLEEATLKQISSRQKVHETKQQDDESLYFHTLSVNDKSKEAVVYLKLNNVRIQCKLDTGAEGNVMSKETFVQNFGPLQQLKRSLTRIIAYGGHTVQHYGMCTLSVRHKNQDPVTCTFHVTNSTGPTLIGLPTCH